VTGADRFGFSIFGSAIAHVFVALGVAFTVPENAPHQALPPTLNVTLANTPSEEEPEEADFIANMQQQGGGDTDEQQIARSPDQVDTDGIKSERASLLAANSRREELNVLLQTAPGIYRLTKAEQTDSVDPNNTDMPMPQQSVPTQQEAKVKGELSPVVEEAKAHLRQKFLSASTRESKYATYMELWRSQVELIGNENYPSEARQKDLAGTLVLDVVLRPDGNIEAIDVIRPSGYDLLDKAAIEIVRKAAPFMPFPRDFREEVDLLHIIRTWQFLRG